MYKKYFKRIFDIVTSTILLIIFFPIMLIIFLFVWLFIGFPIFVQDRPGLNGKIFKFFKFKTLYDVSKKVPEDKRQSIIGNFLRKTGLDELPQLINVLNNDMSIIGPRPLLKEYLTLYSKHEKKRHLAKPGITGLAQINSDFTGKKNWKKSFELDVYYVSNISFLLDMKILIKTLVIIILQKKHYKDFKKFSE